MKITTFFLILFFLISCSKDDVNIQDGITNQEIQESIELKVDGKTFSSINNGVGFTILGTNYQGTSSISVINLDVPEYFFDINYQFTEGGNLIDFELEETKYITGANIVKKFKTPSYKPLNSFQINKFEINESSRKIIIEFSGVLTSVTGSLESREIEGKIFHSYGIMPPWGRDYCYMKSNNSTFDFISSYFQVSGNGSGNQYIDYVSGDGINISIQLDQPLNNFTNLNFDENSTINRVIYRKILSPYIINDSSLGTYSSQQQWETFKTSGNLVISDIYNGSKPGGSIHVKGIINLTVKDQNDNIIDIMQLEFITHN